MVNWSGLYPKCVDSFGRTQKDRNYVHFKSKEIFVEYAYIPLPITQVFNKTLMVVNLHLDSYSL